MLYQILTLYDSELIWKMKIYLIKRSYNPKKYFVRLFMKSDIGGI